MDNTIFRRVVSSALVLALSATCCVPTFADDAKSSAAEGTAVSQDVNAELVDANTRANSYSSYVAKHADDPRPDKEVVVQGKDFTGSADGAEVEVASVDGKDNVLKWSNQNGSVTYEVDIPEDGLYNVEFSYEALEGRTTEIEFSMLIDDVSPYATATRIALPKKWINENGKKIEQDARGNDVKPGQIEEVCWQVSPLKDGDGLFNEPLEFYMTKGKHKITIESAKAQFALEYMKFYQYKEPAGYVAPSESELKQTQGQMIKLEAELADYRSNRALSPTSDKNSYITSSANGQSPTKTRYNTIGKDGNWSQSGQSISYEVDIKEDGYYKIGIRARQDNMRGMYSNRRLYIDDVVPCKYEEAD